MCKTTGHREAQGVYSRLIIGPVLVIAGFFLATSILIGAYIKLLSAGQGSIAARKPSLMGGSGLVSRMLLSAGVV